MKGHLSNTETQDWNSLWCHARKPNISGQGNPAMAISLPLPTSLLRNRVKWPSQKNGPGWGWEDSAANSHSFASLSSELS